MMRTLAMVGSAALTLGLGGCITVHEGADVYERGDVPRSVSSAEFGDVVAANRRVSLGMNKDEALAQYPTELLTLRSSSRVDGALIEEWQAYAVRKDGASSFERWLYFVDGRLVELRDQRVSQDEVHARLAAWRTQ